MKDTTKRIETDRLILRKFEEKDYEDVFKYWAFDEDVAKGAGWTKHGSANYTKELVKIWANEYKDENVFNWLIELKDSHPIGSITVVRKDLKNRTCELGYSIGKDYWNNGYTTEAIKYVVAYLFALELFDTIIGCCYEHNLPSIRVLEKNGFVREGVLRDRYILNGKKVNVVSLSLLKKDYDK